jgi:protease I
MPKILIVTGDAAESLEVMYPYQRLLEEGYEVDIAAPSVKKPQFVVHDFADGFAAYTEKAGCTWPAAGTLTGRRRGRPDGVGAGLA